jgi:xylulokinase
LNLQLTGRLVTDRGDASGTGYWSPTDDDWCPDLLARAHPQLGAGDWRARLPTVAGPAETIGPVTVAAAGHLGLPGPAPLVAAGTGDNMAAALGVALAPGDVAISLGTSGTVFAVSSRPTADATGAVAGFADATGAFLPLVCTLNATQVTDTVGRLLGVDLAPLDAMAATVPLGAGGLVLVPYLNGERTPNRPDATGTITGLRTDATREQVARAAYEGVVCGLLDGLDALRAAGVAVDQGRLVLVGGGARSPRYRQVLADLTGRPVCLAPADELVATGACVQAAAATTGEAPTAVARAWGLDQVQLVEPDPTVSDDQRAAARAAYAAARG